MTDQHHTMTDWQMESRSEYSSSSLKSDLRFLEHNRGSWNMEDGMAVFACRLSGNIRRYSQEDLGLAIQNLERNRLSYKTYDAWRSHLFHFQSGLAMLQGRVVDASDCLLKSSNVFATMAQEVQIEFAASSDFVDRLEELSASMKVSKAEVIGAAIDTLEMVAAADREGKGIAFVPKESNTKQVIDVVFIGGPADGMRKRLEGRDSSALPAQLSYPLEPLPPGLYPPRLYVEVRFGEAVYVRCFCTQGMGGEPVYRWRGNE